MAYNKDIEMRLKSIFDIYPSEIRNHIIDKKMFGGLAFLFHGKMTVGVIKNRLMVRVISDKMVETLKLDAVKPMDFTKRPMKEFIYVDEDGFKTQEQLLHWVELGLEHAKKKLN